MATSQLNKPKGCLVELAALRGFQFNSLCCQLKSEITTAVISSEFPDLPAPGRGRRACFLGSQSLTLLWGGKVAAEVICGCEGCLVTHILCRRLPRWFWESPWGGAALGSAHEGWKKEPCWPTELSPSLHGVVPEPSTVGLLSSAVKPEEPFFVEGSRKAWFYPSSSFLLIKMTSG